ncbi:MAG: aminotransferase class III-fold pyridoxal phosphate-dependent enzyme [Chloroflexota bacterium]
MHTQSSAMLSDFQAHFPKALNKYEEAKQVFPAGVTHDGRYLQPAPIYVTHAEGSRKWDIDGNEYIDYWVGHGALLLGHNHPQVTQAVSEQLQRGTHYGASHQLEIQWGQWIQKLVPSAEKVRLTSSGTEATMMAIRLARGFTGKKKLIRFSGHFHGWHDTVMMGVSLPYDAPNSVGIPDETLSTVVVLPPNEIEAVERAIQTDPEIGAIILEPGGASNGRIPTKAGFLQDLRDVCTKYGVVLIFDEVISGFRYAPGGAQEYFGVMPDMTTMAKIVAGGLPGGAVGGRADIMDQLDFTGDKQRDRYGRMSHPGTYNGNPLSATAGMTALSIAATGDPQKKAGASCLKLIQGLNEVLKFSETPGCVYGDVAGFHFLVGQADFHPEYAENILEYASPERLTVGMGLLAKPMRIAMLMEGIDKPASAGRLSAAHTDEDIGQTISAFEKAIHRMERWGLIGDS